MAKLFVTNSREIISRIRAGLKRTPFKESFVYEKNDIYAVACHKILVNNVNAFESGNNFVILNGTHIYKDKHDITALSEILNEYNGDVDSIRRDSFGNYGIVINKNDAICAFTEASGCYDLYYYYNEKEWLISSSFWDMVAVLKNKLSINRLNILEELGRYTIINNETYFNEIKRLGGDEYIMVDNKGFVVNEIPYVINRVSDIDPNNNVKSISNEIERVARSFFKNYGNPSIGATGGLDSRMSLAAYLRVGSKPKLTYGFGDSFVAPSMQGDYDIDNLLSKKFDLVFECSPWNETIPLDKKWKEFIPQYGNMIYDGNEDAYNFYTRKDEPFVIFGYMGEFFREFEWIEKINTPYINVRQYFDGFYAEPNRALYDYNPELKEKVISKLSDCCRKYGINPNRIQKEEMFYLNLEYRHRADSVMVNMINRFKYSHYLLSEMSILEKTFVPFSWKYNAGYMLKIMNCLNPDVMSIPFFSHCMMQRYDSHNIKLKEMSKPFIVQIKNLIPNSLKNVLKSKGFYRNKALNKYDSIDVLLASENNKSFIEGLFKTKDLSFVKANPDSQFIIRALIIGEQFDYYYGKI